MKEFMSTNTDSSLSPGTKLVLITEDFLGLERDKCLPGGSLLPPAPMAAWLLACLGRSLVLLTSKGLESRAGTTTGTPNSSRDLSGEEWGEEDGALGKVAK